MVQDLLSIRTTLPTLETRRQMREGPRLNAMTINTGVAAESYQLGVKDHCEWMANY
jgi:hypothetical protein